MDARDFEVECPCCQATIWVDRLTGRVSRHEKASQEKKIPSMEEMIRKLSKEKAAIEEKVERESKALKERSRILEEKFQESLKKIDPSDVRPPIRPFDFD
ncbi:MAG TPA: hypothetical protein VN944_05955 [Nitrospiria bacterium]|nr:hypothetical protein [Nitrospiria bacterium]